MEKFATLEPVRLYKTVNNRFSSTFTKPATHPLIGRLPTDLHLLLLTHLPIPDFPAYARASHATAAMADNEKVWEARWNALQVDSDQTKQLQLILDQLEEKVLSDRGEKQRVAPPTISVVVDDEFGDFASSQNTNSNALGLNTLPSQDELGDFVGATPSFSSFPPVTPSFQPARPGISFGFHLPRKDTFKSKYIRAHRLLKPLTTALSSPPHLVLLELINAAAPTTRGSTSASIKQQAQVLKLLSLFLSPRIQPLRAWNSLYASLRAAMDRFDASLLSAFDVADGNNDEEGMREAANASWDVWKGQRDGVKQGILRVGIGFSAQEWEMGKVWAEKREVFYTHGQWDPLDNLTKDGGLDFDAMDEFMNHILKSIIEHGSRAVRVFPPASQVLILFAERLANEVVGEYVTTLLTRAREVSTAVYLRANAASLRESWRMVDAIVQAASEREDSEVSREKAEDVVYQMFETNMDEYLDEEVESLKVALEGVLKSWDKQVEHSSKGNAARFLNSYNPAQVKRNVLQSFTDVLLLPVTIVPRTVGAVGGAIMTGGSAAAQGIAMLNPQRWGGNTNTAAANGAASGYSRQLEKDGRTLFDGEDEDEPDSASYRSSIQVSIPPSSSTSSTLHSPIISKESVEKLDFLLSLDAALELIHADREVLKRVETFAGYPGHYGHRVRDTIEEAFILMLQALGERHIVKGFTFAIERMNAYKPAEHEETTSVAPLLQFFELVHIGDMMQSMVQVYFDKELAPHIDKTDFLNAVVREKKRFENMLDDSVASGLNTGTQLLMNQVEHIILTMTKPREYYPPEDTPLDLGPTKGCLEAIKCLEMHCKLLKGSTSKEVLEVFYQEVGIRLIAIIQKHIKRQIISLSGGFQVIADLNTYHAFISSLKVPSITSDFSHLKMLGHVFVVEDAKDLAQIVRDVTRYGGAYRPEDIYEFIQRRSDWKKIEKVVDKTMYNLSFKEDCTIM
ncbi:hypothetical protein BDN72DRAFT_889964 [Pluteus cervinus]|uniref:Uncharacterized protein n=1 Tax=Pluteus cervinus TaxID=181527 RepID=A0ACD3AAK6_9AGAR|nr:hypothetical protein BDN72DRAFT_889964 [Pluteus cervinus]